MSKGLLETANIGDLKSYMSTSHKVSRQQINAERKNEYQKPCQDNFGTDIAKIGVKDQERVEDTGITIFGQTYPSTGFRVQVDQAVLTTPRRAAV